MADNPAARAAHRAAALAGRRAAERAGVRPTTVSVVVETWSGPIGTDGITLVSTSTTTLSPSPRVLSGAALTGYFGGGTAAASSGVLLAGQYLVGPITLDYPGGGYSQATLCPAAADDRVTYYLLEGDEFTTGGERFRLVDSDATHPHKISLVVERTAQS